ncbi:hypothetical protein H2202_007104 [Exophiala xenobiotica]|nr:hypothetical protein H2202_007104 [Exophiala xenobiotica]
MAGRIELSFLYQTRTILRRPVRSTRPSRRYVSAQSSRRSVRDKDGSASTWEAFAQHDTHRASNSPNSTSSPESRSSTLKSTITSTERRAFEAIQRFAPSEPKPQSEPSGIKSQSPYVDALDTDIENILKIFFSSVQSYHAERDAKTALREQQQKADPVKIDVVEQPAWATPDLDTSQQAAPEPLVHPDADRWEDLSYKGSTSTQPIPQVHHLPRDELPEQSFKQIATPRDFERFNEPIKVAVRKCMADIASALQAAAASTTKRGDIAMWSVCEERIFSLALYLRPTPTRPPRLLGDRLLGAESVHFSPARSDNPLRVLEAAQEAVVSDREALQQRSHDQSLSDEESKDLIYLTILHHVYPAALLFALRLYINHHPSSPLPHNLLPRIRSFGHTSYVLGASTQFYNSLMSLVWMTRSSLREIDALLLEMERGGVELNEETFRVLRQIEDERVADLQQHENHSGVQTGSRGGSWWLRHEQMFWFPRMLDWLGVVSKRLNMTAIEAGHA